MLSLIGRLEIGIRDLERIPETEIELENLLEKELNIFISNNKDDYTVSQMVKIYYVASKKIGVDIFSN